MIKIILIILIYVIVLLFLIILARIISIITRPVIKDTKAKYNNFIDYITNVYCPNKKCKDLPYPIELIIYKDPYNSLTSFSEEERDKHIDESQINIINTLKYFNYIYYNAPRLILDNYTVA